MNDNSEEMFEAQAEKLIIDIHSKYGYDFKNYARPSIYRRVKRFIQNKNLESLDMLEDLIFTDSFYFENFLQELTVNVTEMFRDPSFFLSLRNNVIPMLSTYPHIKIWHAGCSTGEEIYSLAIILKEEGLLDRTKIYATDINQRALRQGKEGIYSASNIHSYTTNYYQAGGKEVFSNYFQSNYGCLKFSSYLINNTIFYPHNLATDFSFNEFHLILCRNVLIYFNKELQERVFRLFNESLVELGYMGLGMKETFSLSGLYKNFELTDKEHRIYRKIY